MKPVYLCLDCAYYAENPYDTAPDLAALIEGRSDGEVAFAHLIDKDATPRSWSCDICLRPEKRTLFAGYIDQVPERQTFGGRT